MVIYGVTARKWEHGWELHTSVGVTNTDLLANAALSAKEYLATELGGEPEDYTVVVVERQESGRALDQGNKS